MKKSKRKFTLVSNLAIAILVALVAVAIAANVILLMSKQLKELGFANPLGYLFDYSKYGGGKHPARFTGQLLSNLVAYAFMLASLIFFVLSLKCIKHDKAMKAKCALLSLFVLVPVFLGLSSGVINFFGEGVKTLVKLQGSNAAIFMFAVVITFGLDFLYLLFVAISVFIGMRTAHKVNKGDIEIEPEEVVAGNYETPEEKAAREEKEAADRVALLEDIRLIVREELDRLDRVVIAKEAPVYVAKKPAPAPAPVEEEEEDEKRKSAPRIPFAKKMVKADKEIQDKYNEIKNEILAYGAKSRVSIACDTFRLHRKAYVKINLVGKTLKVYFALNPKHYEDSPIPVQDASDKVAYEEVPALLKVKSNLSVKRAKELVRQAMEKDGVEKENEAENHNWIRDLRADLRAK